MEIHEILKLDPRKVLVTDRVRSNTVGNVFTLHTILGGWGVYPIQLMGVPFWLTGVANPILLTRAVPHLANGAIGGGGIPPSSREDRGYPHLANGGGGAGTPSRSGWDTPFARWGYPFCWLNVGKVQHSEHLLCGGRYASCIHAGGLSCYIYNGNAVAGAQNLHV